MPLVGHVKIAPVARSLRGPPNYSTVGEVTPNICRRAFVEAPVTQHARLSVGAKLPIANLIRHDERTARTQMVAVFQNGDLATASDPRSDGRGALAVIQA